MMDHKQESEPTEAIHYGLDLQKLNFDIFQDIEGIYLDVMKDPRSPEMRNVFMRTQNPNTLDYLLQFGDGLRLGAMYSPHAKLKLREDKNGIVYPLVDNDIDNLTEEEKGMAAQMAEEFRARVDDYLIAAHLGEQLI